MWIDQVEDPVPQDGIVATRSGASFDDFYRAEMPRLVALARALCGPTLADDVAQEAMLAAYRKWEHVQDLQYPAGWVRRTCANLAVSQYRRRLVELRAVTRLASRPKPMPLEPLDDEFWTAVLRLPARQAQSVALRYVYELEIADIAQTLEISEGSVKQHLSRARTRLAQDLHLNRESVEEVGQ
jgi:RNA polymerase sigma factor (sigma-70 family)